MPPAKKASAEFSRPPDTASVDEADNTMTEEQIVLAERKIYVEERPDPNDAIEFPVYDMEDIRAFKAQIREDAWKKVAKEEAKVMQQAAAAAEEG